MPVSYTHLNGKLEKLMIEIEVEVSSGMGMEIPGMGGESMGDLLSGILPTKTKKRKVSITEARKILEQEEAEKLIDMDEVTQTAIDNAEQNGIIFLDEIDKIAGKGAGNGPDVSREGVQLSLIHSWASPCCGVNPVAHARPEILGWNVRLNPEDRLFE